MNLAQRYNIYSIWRYCTISFPCKSLCLEITAEVSKVAKSLRYDLTFIFIGLSETSDSFVKIHQVLEIKSVASFIKTCFYWKRGCMKMHKHAEMFHAKKCYKLAIVDNLTWLFSKWKFVVHFSNVICTKTRPCPSLWFICKWITSTLSFVWLETNGNVLSSWCTIFSADPFFLRSSAQVPCNFTKINSIRYTLLH